MPSPGALLSMLRSGGWIGPDRIRGYSLLAVGFAIVATGFLWTSGSGLIDAWGRPIGTDFANPYTAGRMALDGRAPEVYDYAAHAAEQRSLFRGGADHPFYPWAYPPIFLLIAALLAMLPYVPALLAWLASTFAIYLAAIWTILPQRLGLLAATAFPGVFLTVAHGHSAFLTAGLLGLGLALLQRRPWIAGILLGCLAYAPHLALVVPVILVFGGYWRPILAAACSAFALAAVSVSVFGMEPWHAFLASADQTRSVLLESGSQGWPKIQSIFAAARNLGAPVALAYVLQATFSLAVLTGLALAWRGGGSTHAKAAACVGALLVTPYVMDFDMAVLAPAGAFLVAAGLRRGFRPYERSVLAVAWVAPLVTRLAAENLHLPVGLLAMTALLAVALRGALQDTARSNRSPAASASAFASR